MNDAALDPSQFPVVLRASRLNVIVIILAILISLPIIIFFIVLACNHPSLFLQQDHGVQSIGYSLLVMILTIPIMLLQITVQITLDRDTITYQNIFFAAKTYHLSEIHSVEKISLRPRYRIKLVDPTRNNFRIWYTFLSDKDKATLAAFFKEKLNVTT